MLCCDSYYNLGCFYLCDSCLDIGLIADADGLWTVEIGQPSGTVKFYENTYAIGDTILMPISALNNASMHYIRVTKPDLTYYEWATDVNCAKFKTAIRINIPSTDCFVNCTTNLAEPTPLTFNFLPNEEISVELIYEFYDSIGCNGNVTVPTVTTNEFSAVATIPNNDTFTVNITPLAMPVADGSYEIPLEITDCCGNVWNSLVTIVVGCVNNSALFTATLQNNAGVVYNSGDENYASGVIAFPLPLGFDCGNAHDNNTSNQPDFTSFITNVVLDRLNNLVGLGVISNLSYSTTGSYPDEIFTVSYVINIDAYINGFGYYPCNKPLVNCEGALGGSAPFTYLPSLNCCSLAPSICPPPDITQYEGVNPINNQTGWAYQHSFVLSGYENCAIEPTIQVIQNHGFIVGISFWNGINGYDGFTIDVIENGALPDGIYPIQVQLVDCCGIQPVLIDINLDLRTCVTGTGSFADSTVYISLSQLDQPFINQFNFAGYSGCLQDVWAQSFPNYPNVTYDGITIDPSNTFFTTQFSAHSGVSIGEVYTMTYNITDCCNNFNTVSFNVEITA